MPCAMAGCTPVTAATASQRESRIAEGVWANFDDDSRSVTVAIFVSNGIVVDGSAMLDDAGTCWELDLGPADAPPGPTNITSPGAGTFCQDPVPLRGELKVSLRMDDVLGGILEVEQLRDPDGYELRSRVELRHQPDGEVTS